MSEYIDKKAVLDMVNTLQYKDVLYPDAAVYNHAIDEVRNLIAVFPTADVAEVPRWIPVTERLPEEKGIYLVTSNDGGMISVETALFLRCIDGDPWWECGVTAWMPLPEAYKMDEVEE